MLFGKVITFSLLEWLAITGLAQTVLFLVYISMRTKSLQQAAVPFLYFFFLASGFVLYLALRLEGFENYVSFSTWLVWALEPPLCYALVLQIIHPARELDRYAWSFLCGVLLLPVLSMGFNANGVCNNGFLACASFFDALYWMSGIVGLLCMLMFWKQKNLFRDALHAKGGRERYWLILLLIGVNLASACVSLLRSYDALAPAAAGEILVVLGLGFTYLISAALFRVYPLPLSLDDVPRIRRSLNAEEKKIAQRVRELLERDKVYHEASFGRADMARELGVSESTLSRVVNVSFGKSLPSLLSECRVKDAKRMLDNPDIPVQTIAFEVGFNSLASFNRVFRELAGETPTSYRNGRGKGASDDS